MYEKGKDFYDNLNKMINETIGKPYEFDIPDMYKMVNGDCNVYDNP
jgi:hypothetical protein